jgi:hypothetical protein
MFPGQSAQADNNSVGSRGALKAGRTAGLQPPKPVPPPPKAEIKKNTDFVYIMISKVLRDLPFSRNQPLKSADDQYINILKNKLIKLKNKKTDTD